MIFLFFNRIRASHGQHYVAVIRRLRGPNPVIIRALLLPTSLLWRPNRCSRSSSQSLPWPCSRVRLSPLTHRPPRRPPSSPLPRPRAITRNTARNLPSLPRRRPTHLPSNRHSFVRGY